MNKLTEKKRSNLCGFTKYKFLGNLTNKNNRGNVVSYIASELMDGDLRKFREDNVLNYQNFISLMATIITQLKCLNDNGFIYTDLKLDNIFYKCISKNQYKIYLGDIGGIPLDTKHIPSSLTPLDFKVLQMTFPSQQNLDGFEYPFDKFMTFTIGVLMLDLLGIDYKAEMGVLPPELTNNNGITKIKLKNLTHGKEMDISQIIDSCLYLPLTPNNDIPNNKQPDIPTFGRLVKHNKNIIFELLEPRISLNNLVNEIFKLNPYKNLRNNRLLPKNKKNKKK